MNIKLYPKKKLFHSNGFGIYSCRPHKDYEKDVEVHPIYGNFTIKGNFPELELEELYEFELGELEISSKGNAYPVESFKLSLNQSSSSQYTFLQALVTPSQFRNICNAYPKSSGIKIIDEIINGTIDLTTIKGIKEKTVSLIIKKIEENKEKSELINILSPLGFTNTTIDSIIKHYGHPQEAINRIKTSFYNLCEVKGLGFMKVDQYAIKNDESPYSVERLIACLNYHIHQFASDGHSWTSKEEMISTLMQSMKIDYEKIIELFEKLKTVNSNILITEDDKVTSFTYLNQEKSVLENLVRLENNFQNTEKEDIDSYIKLAESKLGIIYTQEQREAILNSLQHGVYKINGKGGTGKSQIIKAITTIFEEMGKSYKAVALSGRAAQLLTLKGIDSSTIHRALGYTYEGFEYNKDNPMSYDLIILEESSMVNAELWSNILEAMKDGSQLIIVGDSGQLSGIGNGDVLRDIVKNNSFNGKELMQIHRQAKGSGIIEVANLIREGINIVEFIAEYEEPENKIMFNSFGDNDDLTVITYKGMEDLQVNAYSIIKSKIEQIIDNPEESIMDFQILVSNRDRGEISALAINNYCQSLLDLPKRNKVSNSKYTFLKGDKVIVSGNKYNAVMYESEKDYLFGIPMKKVIENEQHEKEEVVLEVSLFNGTMGIIESLKEIKNQESLLIKFEGHAGLIAIEKEDLNSIDLAYAITIHRSQGMSIKDVLTLIDYSAYKLLSRQLVYTAITRASKKSVLVAQHNALYTAIKTDASGLRRTFLDDMLKKIK